MAHPVQLLVEPATRIPRLHVVIRLALLLALTTLGFSSIYWCLYLALPAIVAVVLTNESGASYLADDGPRIVRVLRWVATTYAYLWFLSNELPTADGSFRRLQWRRCPGSRRPVRCSVGSPGRCPPLGAGESRSRMNWRESRWR